VPADAPGYVGSYYLKGKGVIHAGPFELAWWCDPSPIQSFQQHGSINTPTTVILRNGRPDETYTMRFQVPKLPPVSDPSPEREQSNQFNQMQGPGMGYVLSDVMPTSPTDVIVKGVLEHSIALYDEIHIKGARLIRHGLGGQPIWKFDPGVYKSKLGFNVTVEPSNPKVLDSSDTLRVSYESKGRVLRAQDSFMWLIESSAGPDVRPGGGTMGTTQEGAFNYHIAPNTPFEPALRTYKDFWVRYAVTFKLGSYPFQYEYQIATSPIP